VSELVNIAVRVLLLLLLLLLLYYLLNWSYSCWLGFRMVILIEISSKYKSFFYVCLNCYLKLLPFFIWGTFCCKILGVVCWTRNHFFLQFLYYM
jgi:hypothetical protein